MLTKSRTIAGKILLVEDDPLFGKLTARKLESELKATVIWVKTLAETNALLAQQRHHFIAAVLDFVLPDAFNGEIIEAVHKKGIPSIVFTSNISPEVREFIWSQKVVDYIPKEDPNSLAYLVETIKTLMSNNTNKVLLVEDSSFFRKALSKLLYIHQYQVVMTTFLKWSLGGHDLATSLYTKRQNLCSPNASLSVAVCCCVW